MLECVSFQTVFKCIMLLLFHDEDQTWGGTVSATASKPKYWPNKICGCNIYIYIFLINLMTFLSVKK